MNTEDIDNNANQTSGSKKTKKVEKSKMNKPISIAYVKPEEVFHKRH